jgi:hypothetical protein
VFLKSEQESPAANRRGYFRGQNNYGTPPSPSRPCASFTVRSGNGGRPEAGSLFGRAAIDGALLRKEHCGPEEFK